MVSRIFKAAGSGVLLFVLALAPLGVMGQGKGRGRNTTPRTPRGPVNANVVRTDNDDNGNRNTGGGMNGNTHVNRRNPHPRTPRRVHRGRNTTPKTPRGPINSNQR